MFTTKYRPIDLTDFIGDHNIVILPFIQWLKKQKREKKCMLISGINGCGKSLLSELVLTKYNYHIISINSDQERNKDFFNKTLKPLLSFHSSLSLNLNKQKKNAIIFSDIDGNGADYGLIKNIIDFIKMIPADNDIPIICICDDRYSQSLKPLLQYCVEIKIPKPSYENVYRLIYNIVQREKIKINKSTIDQLYNESNGDIRSILNNLQLNLKKTLHNKDIQSANIFATTEKLLLLDTSLEEKYETFWLEPGLHPAMIQENYINNTLNTRGDNIKQLDNLYYSTEAISTMDIFPQYQSWELKPYIAIECIRATTKCSKRTQLKIPLFKSKKTNLHYYK
jgi:hypothetical protein